MDYLAFMTKYPAITLELPVSTRQISLSVGSSHGTSYLAASRPAGNVVRSCEIRQYRRSFFEIPDTPAWPPTERALSQRPRRCWRSSESSWLSPSI
eukprot:6211746-Pleurochrysis_carterae.AAC.2